MSAHHAASVPTSVNPIVTLDTEECWSLLASAALGRLAVSVADSPDIFPINYYADGSSVLIRTAQGSKLLELTINSRVAFEVDSFTATDGWSVVVKGTAVALEKQKDIFAADDTPLTPWIPTEKEVYVRITPSEITGRRFVFGPEPDRP
ncbi:pyridoxamine 5'-phosphate oxidase family protein [Lacisediminihabitans changchengi]|uniref:Pyridoxamine 5'-phosphate oxidase family protein n=1 Tax=Lacisediminihabitans changchengi TaxID=2787634 RepID=A0A934W395_9MICO|nr:pyridoxamine 5'-phosphate oxidase family protein [Lacisediminihabitans changchengi]MBK4346969.1 pyridoxamine 5'-phosphate oxidase family protein [Lacisediminihabitans changchengi]MBK4347908.1 pyridoxamine 5'-phosphate oxidase family protein [Lacisediminihabitans changchengi]